MDYNYQNIRIVCSPTKHIYHTVINSVHHTVMVQVYTVCTYMAYGYPPFFKHLIRPYLMWQKFCIFLQCPEMRLKILLFLLQNIVRHL